ncbi:MAG: RluA family pseudouridine synthase [Candidatus Spyradocola sp.]
MDKRLNATVPAGMDGKTVKDVARSLLSLSSTRLKKAKRVPGGVRVNGRDVFVTHVVRAGDEVSILIEQEGAASAGVVPTPGDVDVVYEDDYILVLNKPANMPVHPSAGHFDDSLANRCAARFGGVFRPVNRLDAGTSGLMVVARDAHVHALLCKALHTGDFERRYLAVAEGVFAEKQGVVDAPIARVEGSAIQRCVSPDGQRAVTHFRVLRNNGRFSLVELTLETGRTHQIRVHMAHLGHPLAGDFLYGTEDKELIGRAALHAHQLRLTHPITGQTLEFARELPDDMRALTEGMVE